MILTCMFYDYNNHRHKTHLGTRQLALLAGPLCHVALQLALVVATLQRAPAWLATGDVHVGLGAGDLSEQLQLADTAIPHL